MEVGSLLGGAARRWWVVLLVAVLAAGGTYFAVRGTKDTFAGSIVVTVPAAQAGTAGANGQYVVNFSTSLTTADVTDEIAKDTATSATDLQGGLSATQLNNSSFIEIDYDATTPTVAKAVVTSAAKRTATYLARGAVQAATSQEQAAQSALTSARATLTKAQDAVRSFIAKNGQVSPVDRLNNYQSQYTQFNVGKLNSAASGHSTTAFDAAIKDVQNNINKWAPLARDYSGLAGAAAAANTAVQSAQGRVTTAQSVQNTAQAPVLIGTASADRVTASSTIAKAVAIAVGVGLILGIALAVLLAALRPPRSRRRSRRSRRSDRPRPMPAGGEHDAAGEERATDNRAGDADAAGRNVVSGRRPVGAHESG